MSLPTVTAAFGIAVIASTGVFGIATSDPILPSDTAPRAVAVRVASADARQPLGQYLSPQQVAVVPAALPEPQQQRLAVTNENEVPTPSGRRSNTPTQLTTPPAMRPAQPATQPVPGPAMRYPSPAQNTMPSFDPANAPGIISPGSSGVVVPPRPMPASAPAQSQQRMTQPVPVPTPAAAPAPTPTPAPAPQRMAAPTPMPAAPAGMPRQVHAFDGIVASERQLLQRTASTARYEAHIASTRTTEEAEKLWADLRAKLSERHAGAAMHMKLIEVPERGRFVRVLAGDFTDAGATADFCRAVIAAGKDCRILRKLEDHAG
ncbi:SPOR domain-containing protein [Ferrovibrio sp.]|uniref:SPOR domain-containing protein n=1 Tax=Ferrovibrio sp. TaxID=1917215 RepID=UPI003D0C95C1